MAGGKGRASRGTPDAIRALGDGFGLGERQVERLVRASKLSAKVDNAAVQDHHPLYHHPLYHHADLVRLLAADHLPAHRHAHDVGLPQEAGLMPGLRPPDLFQRHPRSLRPWG